MIIQANACSHENISPQIEALTAAVSKMLGRTVRCLSFQAQPLKGGTLGDVRFVTGMAESEDGAQQPYQVVCKRQKKWERPGDPGSWRGSSVNGTPSRSPVISSCLIRAVCRVS